MSTPPPLFETVRFGATERAQLDMEGHLILPGLLTPKACERLTTALAGIQSLLPGDEDYRPNHYAAEFDEYLASLIHHPQMLDLARRVLGEDIRYDHCVSLNRPGGNDGSRWHSHAYSEDDACTAMPECSRVRT